MFSRAVATSLSLNASGAAVAQLSLSILGLVLLTAGCGPPF